MPDPIVIVTERLLTKANIFACLAAGAISDDQATQAIRELEQREAQPCPNRS